MTSESDSQTLTTSKVAIAPIPFATFCVVLWILLVAFFWDGIFHARALSPADLLLQNQVLSSQDEIREPAHRLMSDAVYQFTPWRKKSVALLREGGVPFLNMDTYGGSPHAANFQAAVYSPFRMFFTPGGQPRLFALGLAFEMFLAGVGMYLFLMLLGCSERSRWVGGLCWAFSGFLVVWHLWPHSSAASYATWILLGTECFLQRATLKALLATFFGVFLSWLAGHPQTTCQLLLVAAIYGGYRLWYGNVLKADRGRILTHWCAAVLLGTFAAAFFLMPSFHYLLNSYAWQQRVTNATPFWQIEPTQIYSLPAVFFPYIYGSRMEGYLPLDKVLYAMNTNEIAGGYVSWLVMLVLVPLAWVRRRKITQAWFWVLVVVVCLAIALRIPPFVNLYLAIPLLGSAEPQRMLLFVGLGALVLGVKVLDSWSIEPLTRNEKRGGGGFLLLISVTAFLVAGGCWMFREKIKMQVIEPRMTVLSQRLATHPTFENETADGYLRRLEKTTVQYPAWIGAISLLGLLGMLGAGGHLRFRGAPLVLPAVLVLDLFAFGQGYTPSIEPKDHFPESPAIRFLQEHAGEARVAAAGKSVPPNVFSWYGLSDIRGYDAIEDRRYMEMCSAALEMEKNQPSNFKFHVQEDYTHPFVDGLGLRYLLTVKPLDQLVKNKRRDRFKIVFKSGAVHVYENSSATPGYYLAEEIHVFTDPKERLAKIKEWPFTKRVALLSAGRSESFPLGRGMVYKKGLDHRSMDYEATLEAPGFLVVGVPFLKGWHGEVNGKEVPLVRTNHALIGLPLPKGKSVIHFSYRPPWLSVGLVVSGGAILCFLVWSALLVCGRGAKRR